MWIRQRKSVILAFHNEKQGIDETRVFHKVDKSVDKPKANSVVVIEHENELLLGKYHWQKQQSIGDDQEKFYLISVRGFAETKRFKLSEEEWLNFFPLAVEFIK